MKKLILLFSLVTISCQSFQVNEFNTPFVDTMETSRLEHGLTMKQVTTMVGQPIAILSGGKNNEVWEYEVRFREVVSHKSGKFSQYSHFDILPQKKGEIIKHSEPKYRLMITFENGTLVKWESHPIVN